MVSDKNSEDAIKLLEEDSSKRNASVDKRNVQLIQKYAKEKGLGHSDITRLVRIATSGKLSAAISNSVIRSLIPRENISEEAILCAISKISAGKCHPRIQQLILKWIVLVFELINTKSKVHCLYGILFSLINNDSLAPLVCHLLYLLTRQQDVSHYRIARLIEQQRRVGNQPHINGLLSMYRLYQPSLIFMSSQTKAPFKRFDKEWANSIHSVIMRFGPRTDNSFFPMIVQNPIGSKKGDLIETPKPSLINNATTAIDQPIHQILMGKVHVSDIKSFENVLMYVGNLSLPSQAFSLLSSKFLQHILAISPDSTLMDRLSIWIHQRLLEHLIESSKTSDKASKLLTILFQFMDLFHRPLDVLESFLYRYLCTWNGRDNFDMILKFIAKLPLVHFNVLKECVLNVLHKLYIVAPDVEYRCKILDCLSDLACNYIAVELPKCKNIAGETAGQGQKRTGYSIENLIKFVDYMIMEGLELEPDDLHFLYSAVQFWSSVTTMINIHHCPVFVVPSFPVIYKALFCISSVCISGICETLKNLVQIYTYLKPKNLIRGKNVATLLNQYLNDVHNTLWRGRAFQPLCSENTIAFQGLSVDSMDDLIDEEEEDIVVSSMFSIDKHPAMVTCTVIYFELMQIHAEDIVAPTFVQDQSYMDQLEERGLNDIIELIQLLNDQQAKTDKG